jgi:hypothetical protein
MANDLGMKGNFAKMVPQWIMAPVGKLPFARWGSERDDLICRNGHLTEKWRQFSDIAMKFVSMGISEAEVEILISVQRDVLGTKSTRIEARAAGPLQLRIGRGKT